MCKINFIPISICFCVISLQNYTEILNKYKKGNNTAHSNISFLAINIRNVMQKLESGVAIIAKIHTYTHT